MCQIFQVSKRSNVKGLINMSNVSSFKKVKCQRTDQYTSNFVGFFSPSSFLSLDRVFYFLSNFFLWPSVFFV